MRTTRADVVVIGAGPAGCVTALALGQRGARVLLLESDERPTRQLAGEWIHPPGVAALRRLGVEVPAPGYVEEAGFVVFPDDGSPSITLPYAAGGTGLSFAHAVLIESLRSTAARHPQIILGTGVRVRGVSGDRVTYIARRTGLDGHVTADRIIGADGRSSRLRQAMPGAPRTERLSRLAGVLLRDVSLPVEGYGHIFLGGPGPILAYRLNARTIRMCIDVPLAVRPSGLAAYIAQRYGPALPSPLHKAMTAALCRGEVSWAVNQFQPRRLYGHDRCVLVGDAVGHFHPMTAAGLTLAIMDGECLARSDSPAAYRRERAAKSRAPEMLADALYAVFTSGCPAEEALRQAVYDLWRRDPAERNRTMRLLSIDETRLSRFGAAFLHVAVVATGRLVRQALAERQPRPFLHAVRDLGGWLCWLASGGHSQAERRS